MYHFMPRKLLMALSLSIYVAMPVLTARADDTEIYFGVGTNASARPNVLFIIDDSGSMNTAVSGTGKTRMEIVREGLLSLLDTMNGVNVGLMNFSAPENNTNGGPILYPVRGIDTATEQSFLLQPATNDAYQIDGDTSVTDNTASVVVGKENVSGGGGGPCGSACIELFGDNYISSNENNIENNNTGFNSGTMGQSSNRLGFRFPGLGIPKGATIVNARMMFTQRSLSGSCSGADSIKALSMDIQVENSDNAPAFVDGSSVGSRARLASITPWAVPAGAYVVGQKIYTSDLSSLVQQIVDRAGWNPGNAIAFQTIESGGNDGCRDVYSRSSAPLDGDKPAIEIEWSTGATTSKSVLTGFRFTNVTIPQGSKITSASIDYVPSTGASGTANFEIAAEAVDNAVDFVTTNLASRSLTTNKATWSAGAWSAGTDEATANLKDVVQEVVNRAGWCGGNAMTFVMKGDARRTLYAKESATNLEAKLTINYEPDVAATTACIKTTLSYQVALGGDDAEERTSGSVLTNNGGLNFIVDGSNKNRALGLRFAHVKMPSAGNVTSIESAYLTVTAANSAGTSSSVSINMAQDAQLASMPTADGGLFGLTAASTSPVTWTLSSWTSGQKYNSPNIASVIASAIAHSSWKGDDTGNNMLFTLKGDTSSSGNFSATSFESSSSNAPRLTITYKGRYSPSANDTVRQAMKNMVSALVPQSWTPYSGVLLESANYFKGGEVFFGKQRAYSGGPQSKYRISHPLAIKSGSGTHSLPSGCLSTTSTASACTNETYTGAPLYESPIIDKCQSNHIVFLSDGEPNSNSSTTASKIQSLTGASCSNNSDGKDCSRKVVDWLQGRIGSKDVRTDMDDVQKVKLHTIGFAASIPFLEELATLGDGLYRAAGNSADLQSAFDDIIASVSAENTTFVSAGVTVDQFNRIAHSDQLYFAMFEPTSGTKWHGNVKRYRMSGTTIMDASSPEIAALDPVTEKFKAEAQSFWSVDGDGDDVKAGGAASNLPAPASRVVYTNLEGSSNVNLSNGNNDVADDQATLTAGFLNASDAADRTKIINWARGMDVNNTSAPTAARNQLGDPIHSQPQVVIYDDATTDNQTMLYSTDNEGYLHAFDAETGIEQWSWIPKELIGQLTRFQKNTPMTKRESGANGLDGHIAPYIVDVNINGVIDAGDKVWLMIGMRRGGNNYYMLDVTDRTKPVLKYTITGGSAGFTKLGQTWSKPSFGRIKFGSTTESVAIFTGGYDEAEDNNSAPAGSNAVGNAVYIVRASDGALLWNSAQTKQATGAGLMSTMTHSIPAGVAAVDVKGSGFIESFYVTDLRGQLFRFDVTNGESDITKIITGGRIAHIGGSAIGADANGAVDEANNRRFFTTPAVAAILRPNNKTYVAVAVGSGYRSHPKNVVNKDAFYMFRDQGVLHGTFDKDISQADLLDITAYPAADATIGGKTLVKYIEDNNLRGWKLDLSGTSGEKVLSQPIIFNNQLVFGSYIPVSSNLCSGVLGGGRAYVIDINDGTIEDGVSRYVNLARPGIPADPSIYIGLSDTDGDGDKEFTTVGLFGPEEMDKTLKTAGSCGRDVCTTKWRKIR